MTDRSCEPDDERLAPDLVARFAVRITRCLDADGEVVAERLPDWARDPAVLLPIYRTMVRTRMFDQRALVLQRTGQLGTYGSNLGQEAIGVGVASAMRATDVLLPSYREFSAQLCRGVTMTELLRYWGGDERGSDYAAPREDFPICVPIATHACHAVGVAYAFKLRGEARVAVCFVGDGATSKGDFYESLNAAGVWELPLVFVVSNNGWAISVPRQRQSAARTLAQKAIAAGVANRQVDGNDPIAVRAVAAEALGHARAGQGPFLIEALTYRLGDHTTADDASRYRDPGEVEAQRRYEPLARLRTYLQRAGLWSDPEQVALEAQCTEDIDAAVQEYADTPPQPATVMFDYLYEQLPAALAAQRRALPGASDGDDGVSDADG